MINVIGLKYCVQMYGTIEQILMNNYVAIDRAESMDHNSLKSVYGISKKSNR